MTLVDAGQSHNKSLKTIFSFLLFPFKFFFKQFSQCSFITISYGRFHVWINLLEVLFQLVQELCYQQQLLPRGFLVTEQIAQQCIELAYTEIFPALDFLLSVTTKMRMTQTSCCVASATINQLFGKRQNRWSLNESFHVTFKIKLCLWTTSKG